MADHQPAPTSSLEEIARLPVRLAQLHLARHGREGDALLADVGWHGASRRTDRSRFASFALVQRGGPLEHAVGRVLRITSRGTGRPPLYVYAVAASEAIPHALTVTRRLFFELALPAEGTARARVELVPGEAAAGG